MSAEMDEFVERVRERSDIYSVVSRYVALSFRGGRYWACCPFHEEKTPSFTIAPDKGFFYCFGCHVGGNVFKFISMMENVSYFDAVKLQAERLGISLPSRKKTETELNLEREENILFKINEAARDFYHNFLIKTAEGEAGRKYLNARGITNDTIENFKLGFAPNSWDRLTNAFFKRGFTSEQLMSAGLISKQRNGEKFFDRMRGRVIIPITDIFGHVVGFGGRILNSNEENDLPKYLNTPETKIFNKGMLLFGLDKAVPHIRAKKFVIVVEGYMDAISLAGAGIENVVATLGTAFTENHAKLLEKYSRKIVFCYDSDEAGQRATVRALSIVEKTGAEILVVTIPDGKDPDDFIRKHGKKDFDKLLKKALPLFDYRLEYILQHSNLSTTSGKVEAMKKILPFALNTNGSAKQSEYRKKISSAFRIDEDTVLKECRRLSEMPEIQNKTSSKIVKMPQASKKDTLLAQACEIILLMSWQECDLLDFALSIVPREAFSEVQREIISYIEKCSDKEKQPDDIGAAAELSEEANTELSRILNDPREMNLEAFEESVHFAKRAWTQKIYDDNIKKVIEQLSIDDPAYVGEMRTTVQLQKKLDELK